jgi:hypothetical protein
MNGKKMDITRNNIELFTAVSCRSHTSQSNIFYVRKRGQSQHTPKVHPGKKEKADEKECTETKTSTGRFRFHAYPIV